MASPGRFEARLPSENEIAQRRMSAARRETLRRSQTAISIAAVQDDEASYSSTAR